MGTPARFHVARQERSTPLARWLTRARPDGEAGVPVGGATSRTATLRS